MTTPALSNVAPGELDATRLQELVAGWREADPRWPEAPPLIEPAPVLRLLSEVLADLASRPIGVVTASRALDDRIDDADLPQGVLTLEERATRARRELDALAPAFVERIRKASAATRGCRHCKSQVDVLFVAAATGPSGVASVDCPVCKAEDFCFPQGDRDRKAERLAKSNELAASASEARRKVLARRNNVVWAVAAGTVDREPAAAGA